MDFGRLKSFAGRQMDRQLRKTAGTWFEAPTDRLIQEKTVQWIEESTLDRVVLLALDWIYRIDGSRDGARTVVATGNDYVAETARLSRKIIFGASVHPYRHDALHELSRLADLGASLVKWIPSAQRIKADHPACFPFYDALARTGIPLLCHSGVEHVLPGGTTTLNDPRRLSPALDRGVTVIAAHLGAPMTLYEPNFIRHWTRMTRRYCRLFGDVSALAVPLRAAMLRFIARRDDICSRMLYGSDYPQPAWPRLIALQLGLRNVRSIARMPNPFDKSLATVRGLGLPDHVFSRAEKVLRFA